jgi:hypothetical protein
MSSLGLHHPSSETVKLRANVLEFIGFGLRCGDRVLFSPDLESLKQRGAEGARNISEIFLVMW